MNTAFTAWIKTALQHISEAVCGEPDVTAIWSLSAATPRLEVAELSGSALVLKAALPGHASKALMSMALTAGEMRAGLVLPKTAVAHGADNLVAKIERIYDGRGATITRHLPGGSVLLDWHFHDAPFTADWMVRAAADALHHEALVHRASYILQTLWRGAVEVIATSGRFDLVADLLVVSDQDLPAADLTKRAPVVIFDAMYQPETKQWLTVVRSEIEAEDLEHILRDLGIVAKVRPVMRHAPEDVF